MLTEAVKSRKHPSDAQFVENVMWEQGRVVFVTLNLPGSNNDGLIWTKPFTNESARAAEAAQRTLADIRWLDAAFDRAEEEHAKAMVIGIQADMWDPAAVVAGGDGLGNYTIFVHELRNAVCGLAAGTQSTATRTYSVRQTTCRSQQRNGQVHGTRLCPAARITVQARRLRRQNAAADHRPRLAAYSAG
jgi:hypothetical protein